jgi:hypothetical protein
VQVQGGKRQHPGSDAFQHSGRRHLKKPQKQQTNKHTKKKHLAGT